MRPIISHDVPGLNTVDEILEKLELVLLDLMSIADDIHGKEDRDLMQANIKFMKSYYERAERLLLDQKGNKNVPVITRPIESAVEQPRITQVPKQGVGAAMPKQRKNISLRSPWNTTG